MLTIEKIDEFQRVYFENLELIKAWNQKLMKKTGRDEWIKIIYSRSFAMRAVYLENQKQLDVLFQGLREPLDQSICDYLYELLFYIFYETSHDDAVVMLTIADALLPYYAQEEERQIHLLNVKSFYYTEYFYRQSSHPTAYSLDLHKQIYSYRNRYLKLKEEERRILLVSIYNMTCCLPLILPHEVNHALDIYDEYLAMSSDSAFLVLERDAPSTRKRMQIINESIWNLAEVLEHFDQEHLLHFYELLVAARSQHKGHSDDSSALHILESAYYYTSAFVQGNGYLQTGISWKTAYAFLIRKAEKLMHAVEQHMPAVLQDDFLQDLYYPYQQTVNFVFKSYPHIQNPQEEKVLQELIQRGTSIITELPKEDRSLLIYAMHAEWCEHAVAVLGSNEEKERLMMSVIVKGQLQTYIHSQMVVLLADAILKQLLEKRAVLLTGLPGLQNQEAVQQKAEEIRSYVRKAGLFHDIGKNRITGVINQQTRRLSEAEFALIKEHPEYPDNSNLKHDPYFSQFYEIIAGHHKSYNGLFGYPKNFDNVHSPCRIFIDLITICDCLDAATDRLGRNYCGGKDFHEVLKELYAGSGTYYNPDIVSLLQEDKALQEELQTMVDQGRMEIYFQTYQEYYSI